MIMYKNIKGIALGTAVAVALCLLGNYKSNADRFELSAYLRGGVLGGEYDVFGTKAKAKETSATEEKNKPEEKESKFGLMDTLSFRFGGSLGYTYDIVEYFGAGLVGGVGYTETKPLDVEGGKITFSMMQGFVGPRLVVYPLGEQSFILGLDVLFKFNIPAVSKIANSAAKDKKEKVEENTRKAVPVFAGMGAMIRGGYDFRDLMDFPLFLGLDLDFTYYFKGLIASSKPDSEVEVFGTEIKKGEDGLKSPNMDISLGASVSIDFAYYIF